MKLAAIILPWGGYTSYETIGGWNGANGMVEGEMAVKYEVAMERADTPKLRGLAQYIAYKAQQEAVMIVTANGDVEFCREENKHLTPPDLVA